METINTNNKFLPIYLKGFLTGIGGLSLFYYLILLAVTKDFEHPINQFKLYQPWMSILIFGFGIQVGLYLLLRRGFRLNLSQKRDHVQSLSKEPKIVASTGGVMSGASMAACCAHHIIDVSPILGVTGTAVFLTEYQMQFLMLGVLANLIGIIYMAWLITGRKQIKEIYAIVLAGKAGSL